ncbi:aminodeoxychorismate synthase component I [Corallincola luteus]|uniref:aminodeoxychorismate synthase n=1 Tax=Corallincola luteus TaxID=1775177 RepID=A0ABY2AJD4_9GAMM|nr:aminodeoxychorismate synthase component I [Corallincola luteus]TCI01833.1 aminodeoxychorismate synthase component I [Corallincola luteus]
MNNLLHLHHFTGEADSLLQVFSTIAERPWSMLLDSGTSSHTDAQYDIAVFSPRLVLIAKNGSSQATSNTGADIPCPAEPFEAMRCLQQEFMPELPSCELPFCGGWLGYFSYDLGRYIEKLPNTAIDDISLPDLALGLYDKGLIRHKQSGKVTAFAWSAAGLEEAKELYLSSNQAASELQPFSLISDWHSNMTPESYAEKFHQVQSFLRSGDCYQINLAQRLHAHYQGSEWQAFKKLHRANNAPFSAYIKLPDTVIISLSPERLLLLDNGRIQTKPIKGTRRRKLCDAEDEAAVNDLLTAEKDQAENLMIVDLLRNDLSKVATAGSVRVPSLFAVESFPAVHHLVSTIEAELADHADCYDLLKGAFPGGSITGAPKVRAMEIIEQLEPHRRSAYCGAIGYLSACGRMDTNIAIRTLIGEKQTMYCWGGGGLVADSHCDEEYQETLDKLAKILPILSETKSPSQADDT